MSPAGGATRGSRESSALVRAIDWGELAPLALRAREIAEGLYAGVHRSALRGAGVEFGGYREYVVGDDLRWLDRRSLLRHERLVVRQFETETDRSVCLLLDASASMAYRGPRAPGAKLAFGAVVCAALARLAVSSGDPVSLAFVAGEHAAGVRRAGGREQFDRVVAALEAIHAAGDALTDAALLDRAVQQVARSTRRGAIIVVVGDLLDWPAGALERVATLRAGGRHLVVVRVLDPAERDFPFTGTVRLRALEGQALVETDADRTRDSYRAALAASTQAWREGIVARGGRFVSSVTTDRPVDVVREVLKAIR